MCRDRRIMDNLFCLLSDQEVEKPEKKARLAAAVAHRGRVLAFGFNDYVKSHPFQARYGVREDSIYPHAEIAAINNFIRKRMDVDLGDCDLYVCRLKRAKDRKSHVHGMAKPCSGCMRCISQFNLRRVIYSLDDTHEYEVMER